MLVDFPTLPQFARYSMFSPTGSPTCPLQSKLCSLKLTVLSEEINIHLLVKGTDELVIARSLQLIAGRTAQEFNRRKHCLRYQKYPPNRRVSFLIVVDNRRFSD